MKETVKKWLDSEFVSDEDKAIIKGLSDNDLTEAFHKNVEFGTAGMRGLMGVGTNRINVHTIKRAALAYAMFINGRDVNKRVAIAYDNRNNSKLFAEVSAKVLASQNIEVLMYKEVTATPLLSFAVRECNCGGGIIITASHNPKEYNGFKVYNEEGCQLVTDLVKTVIENVATLDNYLEISTDLTKEQEALIKVIDDSVVEKYIKIALDFQINKNTNDNFKVVYSSQHGAGINIIPEILKQANYDYTIVESQASLDGNFTNTLSPNPEDEKAYVEGIKIAEEIKANIVVTSDPDADRLGVAVLHNGDYRLLNGNETTALMLYYILDEKAKRDILPTNPLVINTVVTSDIGEKIAEAYGARTFKTLTGFKYIGTLIDQDDNLENYVYGYEESYGSMPIPVIRDKDAASATMILCEMAAYYDLDNKTLVDVLNEVYERFGYHYDKQESITVAGLEGPAKIKAIMGEFNSETLGNKTGGEIVAIENYETSTRITKDETSTLDYEKSAVMKLFFKDLGWIAIRPSGTEPKIKVYYGAQGDTYEQSLENYKKLNDYVSEKIK